MSIGWGFAGGAGKALYDVTDQRIKDSMLERRDLRAREAQMELERFRSQLRRGERAEERSYLQSEAEKQRQYDTEAAATKFEREKELAGIRESGADRRARIAAGKTGSAKRFKSVVINTDQGEKLFTFDEVEGTFSPYQGTEGRPGMSGQDLETEYERFYDAYLPNRVLPNSDEDLHAAADALGLPRQKSGEPYSEDRIKHEWFKRQRTGDQPETAITTRAEVTPATPATAASKAREESKISIDEHKKAAELREKFRKDPTKYPSYLEQQGFSPEEIGRKAEKLGLVKQDNKWVIAPEAEESRQSSRFRSEEGKKAVENRERVAQLWAKNLTVEAAKKQFSTGPEMNRFLRQKGYLEFMTDAQRKRIFYIMRKLPKPE